MATAEQLRYAHIALSRFGLGAQPRSLQRISADPVGAVLEELDRPERLIIRNEALPTTDEVLRTTHTTFLAEDELMRRELRARVQHQLQTPIGFLERLVLFWSNHFNMTISKNGAIRAAIGHYERQVVRRRLLGSFGELLTATMHHPTMLGYLDNADSMGPNSVEGLRRGSGLNVNLARELLELHTLGVGSGYTEDDVFNLACILTGWSYVRGWEARHGANGGNTENHGEFMFRRDWHEPGAFYLVGRRYSQRGQRKGYQALQDLAKHPATAQHLAFKLVHHFLTDQPTPNLVEPIARALRDSEGDLKETARALVQLPEAWSLPLTKIRRPYELLIAQMRAMGRNYHEDDLWRFDEALRGLGNKPWLWAPPDGYPDENEHWLTPDGVRVRADAIQMTTWTLLHREDRRRAPARVARRVLGPALRRRTLRNIRRSRNAQEAFAVLFLSPEFQRR